MKIVLMYQPSESHRAALEAAAPGASLLIARDEAHAAALVVDADAVLGNRYFLQSLPHARRLRWMQSNSMGVDRILAAGSALDSITLTNARGVYDDEMAEHALALSLALARGLHLARDDQGLGRWERRPLRRVAGMRVLVLGWGGVGRGVARRLRALGAHVEGVRRSGPVEPQPDSDGTLIWGPDRWRDALPGTDLLVLALPLTEQTRHLVAARELALLPHDALLVNVGRGGTLDEAALAAALAAGSLGGAALDVLEHEPPRKDHPLLREPRALITPHVGRSPEAPPHRWEALFVENLRRFAAGEALLNVVDREAGY